MSMMNIQVKYKTDRTSQWTEFGYVDIPVSGHDKLNTELDLSELIIKDTTLATRLEKYTLIGLFIDTILKRTYYVEQDDIAQSRLTLTAPLYTHDMQLVEESRIAQGYVMENITFTNNENISAVFTWEQLVTAINNNITNKTKEIIILGSDIYYNSEYPINSGFSNFYGILNGNGHTIYNVELTNTGTIVGNSYGIFRQTNIYSKISNLTLDNANLTYNLDGIEYYSINIGILCGTNNGTIQKVRIQNSALNLNHTSGAGGAIINSGIIAGKNTAGLDIEETEENQTNIDNIESKNNTINIYTNNTKSGWTTSDLFTLYIGSIFGEHNGATINCDLLNIKAEDIIYASKEVGSNATCNITLGGLIGTLTKSTIFHKTVSTNFYFISPAMAYPSYNTVVLDALIGNGGSTYVEFFFTGYYRRDLPGEITTTVADAVNKTSEELKLQATYVGWDFETIWYINEGITTPTLRLYPMYIKVSSYSIKSMLERICNIVKLQTATFTENITNFLYVDPTPIFTLSTELTSVLDSGRQYYLAPECFFNKLTLWEIFLFIGGIINAIPYVQDYEIHYMFLNNNNIEWLPATNVNYNRNKYMQNGSQYATELVSFNSNVISEINGSQSTIIYPGINEFVTPRADNENDIRVNNSNCFVMLPFKAYEIKKLYITNIYKDSFEYFYPGSNKLIYDISDYIVERKIFNALPNTKDGKGLHITYDQYDTKIYGFSDTPIQGYLPELPILTNILTRIFSENAVTADIRPFKDMMFRVEYSPSADNATTTGRNDITDFNHYNALNYNQDTNQVTSESLGKNKVAKLNQMGVIETEQDFVLPTFDDLPTIGQTYNGLFINEVIWNLYNNLVKCTVILTKDFNRISEYIDINRRKRPYPIPNDTFITDRHLRYKEYIVFSDTNVEDGGYITSDAKETILNTCSETSTSGNEISSCIIGLYNKLDEETAYELLLSEYGGKIILPVVSNYSGNAITFTVQFESNVSASDRLTTEDTNNALSTPVLYTENGYLDYISPKFVTTLYNYSTDANAKSRADLYPLLTSGINGITQIDFLYNPLYIAKDPREIIKLNYEIQFIRTNGNIIIGNKLVQDCPLIYTQIGSKTRKIYGLKRKLGTYEQSIDNSFADELDATISVTGTHNNQLNVTFNNITTNYVGWVITDVNDEIYLGRHEPLTSLSTNSTAIYTYTKGAN